jgi:peroxiredoxin
MMGKMRVCLLLACLLLALVAACVQGEQGQGKLKIGDAAPDFTAVDLAGQPVSLAGYRGHPLILRFWSTECRYCRADTPIFNAYFNKYREAGLRVVYINRDADEETVRRFVADLFIPFPVVRDQGGRISASYDVRIEPQTIFISPEQEIIGAVLGGVSEAEMRGLLGEYLDLAGPDS